MEDKDWERIGQSGFLLIGVRLIHQSMNCILVYNSHLPLIPRIACPCNAIPHCSTDTDSSNYSPGEKGKKIWLELSQTPFSLACSVEGAPQSMESDALLLVSVTARLWRRGRKGGFNITLLHVAFIFGSNVGKRSRKFATFCLQDAKSSGASVTVETCPHYLAFAAEEIADGDTRFKCAPPIRDAVNRQKLWEALMEQHIDMLSSDHSPSVPDLKLFDEGDFLKAWGGISSLQFVLPVTWSYGRKYRITLTQLATWWSERPAKLSGQIHKGAIVRGNHADLVVWEPEVEFELDENHKTYHKHPTISPYMGMRLSGKVLATFVRGNIVYGRGKHAPEACGVPILAK
ncbi:allantoinase-like [Elaeis guineensis]|uniref:allantoinase-like n=1 Tax=Elaeis guineensis var. tenera TaxID=51953 RepID=UPI003C6D8949